MFVSLVGANVDLSPLVAANLAVAAQGGCAEVALASYGCRRTGPGWLGCFGIACTAVQVGCAVQTWF